MTYHCSLQISGTICEYPPESISFNNRDVIKEGLIMSKRVITINRMLGSNGRLIGKALAEELGFAFYDKELIDIAAQKENIPFDLLAKVDEKRGSQWRFPIDHELQMDSDVHFVPINDVLFDLQRKIILDAAEKEDCVIVGRCANHILVY